MPAREPARCAICGAEVEFANSTRITVQDCKTVTETHRHYGWPVKRQRSRQPIKALIICPKCRSEAIQRVKDIRKVGTNERDR